MDGLDRNDERRMSSSPPAPPCVTPRVSGDGDRGVPRMSVIQSKLLVESGDLGCVGVRRPGMGSRRWLWKEVGRPAMGGTAEPEGGMGRKRCARTACTHRDNTVGQRRVHHGPTHAPRSTVPPSTHLLGVFDKHRRDGCRDRRAPPLDLLVRDGSAHACPAVVRCRRLLVGEATDALVVEAAGTNQVNLGTLALVSGGKHQRNDTQRTCGVSTHSAAGATRGRGVGQHALDEDDDHDTNDAGHAQQDQHAQDQLHLS